MAETPVMEETPVMAETSDTPRDLLGHVVQGMSRHRQARFPLARSCALDSACSCAVPIDPTARDSTSGSTSPQAPPAASPSCCETCISSRNRPLTPQARNRQSQDLLQGHGPNCHRPRCRRLMAEPVSEVSLLSSWLSWPSNQAIVVVCMWTW